MRREYLVERPLQTLDIVAGIEFFEPAANVRRGRLDEAAHRIGVQIRATNPKFKRLARNGN